MTYNPRSIFQSYDQYGRAKKKQASKPNPGKQFADSMKAGGGGRNMSGIGAKPAPSRTSTFDQFKRRERNKGLASKPSFGGAQDNNPNRDEAENKSSVKKLYEKTVNFLKSFGADEPEALIVDGQRVYQGPAFRGFQPTIPTENFGGKYGKQQYLFDSPELGIKTTRSPVPPTLPPGTVNRLGVNRDNPRLNMFGVNRGFTKPPASPELPTSPDVPANVDAITRGISQALIPTEVDYTIKVGDTLSEIAKDRGTTVEVLMELNDIKEKDKDTIFAGDKLKVPPKKAKTYKDVDDDKFASSGQIMSDAFDPDFQFYKSFRQGIMTKKDFDEALVDRIVELEGYIPEAEMAFKTDRFPTIGYGQSDSTVKLGQKTTQKQAEKNLREKLIPEKIKTAKRLFPDFDEFSDPLKIEIVQGVFRGDFKKEHDTVKLINQKKWDEASVEFLNHAEYEEAKRLGRRSDRRGIVPRLEAISQAIKEEQYK